MKTPFKPSFYSHKKLGFHEIYWGKKRSTRSIMEGKLFWFIFVEM